MTRCWPVMTMLLLGCAAQGVNAAAAVSASAKAQILRVDREWAEAEKKRDEKALRRILSDNFLLVYASGQSADKETFIKSIMENDLDHVKSQSTSDVTVRVDGDTAVLSEIYNLRGTNDGQPYSSSTRITTTYVKRSGRWQALAERFGRNVDLVADEAAVRKTDGEWLKAAQSGQANQWLWFYTDDAIVLPPNDKVARGKEEARKSVTELLALPSLTIVWQASKVEVAKSGDIAYEVGTYDISYKDANGNTVSDQGKMLEIWKKQVGGDWKCSVDTWNSDLPAS